MAKYITVNSQGYLTSILNVGPGMDLSGLQPQVGDELIEVTDSFNTVKPRPNAANGVDLRYHVARARWEDVQTGQQYPQLDFTITTL